MNNFELIVLFFPTIAIFLAIIFYFIVCYEINKTHHKALRKAVKMKIEELRK